MSTKTIASFRRESNRRHAGFLAQMLLYICLLIETRFFESPHCLTIVLITAAMVLSHINLNR